MAAHQRVLVRRSAERFTTVGDGVRTRHLLSFGDHYDPDLTALGPLVAHNDEVVEPGSGYPPHRHVGVEIVTWVVSGRLLHRDPAGEADLGPGSAQLLSAGSGVTHEEAGGSADVGDDDPVTAPRPLGATRFIQMWLASDEVEGRPRHSVARFDDATLQTRLVPIASGAPIPTEGAEPEPLPLRRAGALCLAGRIAAGTTRALPASHGVHVFVVGGEIRLGRDGVRLRTGDSALLAEPPATDCLAATDVEVVVWAWER
jgi:redox-sensitive bicupin YhaK (pirin superfamily)